MADVKSLLAEKLFPSIQWRGTAGGISLTFDDGPHPEATPQVLAVLKQFQIKATFFLVGKNIEAFPAVVREIVAHGHTIGNHSYSHLPLWFKSNRFIKEELRRTSRLLAELAGHNTALFRPPHSRFEPSMLKVVQQAGYRCVMYTVDSKDYRLTDVDAIVRRTTDALSAGDIVLLHDNAATAPRIRETLTRIIESAQLQRYTFSNL